METPSSHRVAMTQRALEEIPRQNREKKNKTHVGAAASSLCSFGAACGVLRVCRVSPPSGLPQPLRRRGAAGLVAAAFPRGASWEEPPTSSSRLLLLGLLYAPALAQAAGAGAGLGVRRGRCSRPGMVEAGGIRVKLRACCGLLCWSRG